MEVWKRDYPSEILSICEGINGLSIQSDWDGDDTLVFKWCHYGRVLDRFTFSPGSTEASDLRNFLSRNNWYALASMYRVLLMADITLTEAKKGGYFRTLEDLASPLEGEDAETREITRRASEQLSLIENFSFGSLLKSQWFINYLSLELDCSVNVIGTLMPTLEKSVEIVDK